MNRTLRQQRILDLVRAGGVKSQDDLRLKLEREGLSVTQSTLSRDLKELSLVKGSNGYLVPPEGQQPTPRQTVEKAAQQDLVSCKRAGNLLVLKTAVGHAQPLALAIDRGKVEGVMGTIAGDDTVLIVAPDDTQALQIEQFLCRAAGLD